MLVTQTSCQTACLYPCAQEARIEKRLQEEYGVRLDPSPAVQSFLRDPSAQPLSRELAVAIAFVHNPSFQAELQELARAHAHWVQAGIVRNPSLDLQALLYSSQSLLEAGITQSLLDLIQRGLRMEEASAQLWQVELQVLARALDLVAELRQSYDLFQIRQAQLRLRQGEQECLALQRELGERMRQAGNLSDYDLNILQMKETQAALETAAQQQKLQALQEHLQRLMGLGEESPLWTIPVALPPLPPVRPPISAAALLDEHLDLEIEQLRLCEIAAAMGMERRERVLGDAEVGVHGEREDGDWYLGPSLKIALPLFDRGAASERAAQAALCQQEWRIQALRAELLSQWRELLQKQDRLRGQWTLLHQRAIPLAEAKTRQAHQLYNAMQIGVPELLEHKREELEFKRGALDSYLEALYLAHALDVFEAGHVMQALKENGE
jgi:outer membrane protein TolC